METDMTGERILSADSHIVEPADFWSRYIDADFADKAPRARTDGHGNVEFLVDGDTVLGSVGAPSQVGIRFDDPSAVTFEGSWDEVRPGCSDPGPRRADMERDGIDGEVIFPTLGARIYGVIRGPLRQACFRAGNDWLSKDFCAADSNRFKGMALLDPDDVPAAVAELTRCVAAGLAGAMIPTYPGEERPYFHADYDPLWAAAQDLDVPLTFHIAATCAGPGQLSIFTSEWNAPDAAAYSVTQDYWVRRSLGSMIFAGVFERFPGLRIAVVEHELAWAPYFLEKMDVTYKELSQTAPYRFKDQVLPSDFFRSQIFCTFQEDKRGLHMLSDMIGTDTMMFGSDYPHAESTWPRSRQFIDDLLAGVDQDVRRKLVCDNVAGLFKFN
ncbi:MAG: amidohydrolase family protein [Alphaproteobacteria bacterium]|jgi:predicted TIM-barrel fold metal-dependent hydrolase